MTEKLFCSRLTPEDLTRDQLITALKKCWRVRGKQARVVMPLIQPLLEADGEEVFTCVERIREAIQRSSG
jgi:hypothetical protein